MAVNLPEPVRLVPVKLSPVGRAQTFLDDRASRVALHSGDQVVVHAENGPALGTVGRSIQEINARRRPPADSPQRVVRVATRDDIVARLKHEQR